MDGTERSEPSYDELFAASVKRLREERGWSQGELAKRMVEAGNEGFHQTTISRIEKNERPVRVGEARQFATIFDTNVGVMISPPAEWRVVDAFRREVLDLASAEGVVGEAVVRYLHQRDLVKKTWDDLKDFGAPSGLEENIQRYVEAFEDRAGQLLARSYLDAIDDAVDPSGKLRAEADGAEE